MEIEIAIEKYIYIYWFPELPSTHISTTNEFILLTNVTKRLSSIKFIIVYLSVFIKHIYS